MYEMNAKTTDATDYIQEDVLSLRIKNERLEQEKCELLGIIQSKDEAIKDMQDNYDAYKAVAEPEIDRLNKKCGKLEGKIQDWTSEYYELENFMNNKLDEAKKIIKDFVDRDDSCWSIQKRAEEFLKECQ